jgi:hypothetical protein
VKLVHVPSLGFAGAAIGAVCGLKLATLYGWQTGLLAFAIPFCGCVAWGHAVNALFDVWTRHRSR